MYTLKLHIHETKSPFHFTYGLELCISVQFNILLPILLLCEKSQNYLLCDNMVTGQAYHTPQGYPDGITGKGKLKYSGENLLQNHFCPLKTPELSLD
jgi:hypothetical protein